MAVSAFGLAAGMKPCAGRIPCHIVFLARKLKPEKIERLVREVATPVRILAVDDFLSSQDAAPTCRPQSGRQARSIRAPRSDRSIAVLEFLQQQFGVAILAGDFRADDKPVFIGNRPRPRGIAGRGCGQENPRHPRRRFAALFFGQVHIACETQQPVEFDRGLFLARGRGRFRNCFGTRLIGPRGGRAEFLRNPREAALGFLSLPRRTWSRLIGRLQNSRHPLVQTASSRPTRSNHFSAESCESEPQVRRVRLAQLRFVGPPVCEDRRCDTLRYWPRS